MKKFISILLAVVMALSLAACGGESRTVSTDGSTSMEQVIGALKETFEGANGGVEVTYNPTGSGTRGSFEEIVGVEDACAYRQELTSTGDVITSADANEVITAAGVVSAN